MSKREKSGLEFLEEAAEGMIRGLRDAPPDFGDDEEAQDRRLRTMMRAAELLTKITESKRKTAKANAKAGEDMSPQSIVIYARTLSVSARVQLIRDLQRIDSKISVLG